MLSTLKPLGHLLNVAFVNPIEVSLYHQLEAIVETKEFHLGTPESHTRSGAQNDDGYRSALAFHHETLGIFEVQVPSLVQPFF